MECEMFAEYEDAIITNLRKRIAVKLSIRKKERLNPVNFNI